MLKGEVEGQLYLEGTHRNWYVIPTNFPQSFSVLQGNSLEFENAGRADVTLGDSPYSLTPWAPLRWPCVVTSLE